MSTVKNVTEQCSNVFEATEVALTQWDFSSGKNLQFPDLTLTVASKLGITLESEMKEVDGLIRYYVRRHDAYKSKRGAGGGIALASMENSKIASLSARKAAKVAAAEAVAERLGARGDKHDQESGLI
ncbi:MAG: hypothetical protein KBD37_10295 [Burkholderiales bacterium]|nr:hypothetical protein [Burkholderiales bacterium]